MIFAEPLEPLTRRQRNAALALGALVAVTRLLALSRSMWDWDEALFTMGVRGYDVTQHHPHPPGYPLFMLAAKIVHLAVRDEFRSVQIVALLAALALFPALFFLARELRFPFAVAAGGAALCAFFPNVWYYGGTALSDIPSLVLVAAAAALLLRGCRDRRAYLLGALVLALAAGVRPQNLLVGFAPALIATVSCFQGAGRRGQGADGVFADARASAEQPPAPRAPRPATFAAAALLGAVVIVASYAGAALASDSWRGYVDACAAQSHYIRLIDSYVNPGRPPLLRLAREIFVQPMHGGRFDLVLTALAALGFVLGARRAGVRVAVAMFLPIQLFTWLMLDVSNFPRYSVAFLPMYAFLVAYAFAWMRAWAAIPYAAIVVQLVVWTLPSLNEVRRTDSPVAAAMKSVRGAKTVFVQGGVGPFASALLPDQNLVDVEKESELPLTDAPFVREGATATPGARVFRRSRRGHLATFVRMHFFEVSVIPAARAGVFRDGWYAEETDGETSWRWMSGRGTMLLPPAGPHARLTMRFAIPSTTLPSAPLLTLQLNGRELGRWRCTSEEMTASVVAAARPDAPNELVISIAPVFNPLREHVSGDPRDLGLRLSAYDWGTE